MFCAPPTCLLGQRETDINLNPSILDSFVQSAAMRSSFHSPQKTVGTSSFLANGGRGAVAPISALKLLRIGMKRRRGEGSAYYDAPTNGREAVDANDNVNDHNINEKSNGGNDDLPLSPPSSSSSSSSSSPFCLMNNPFFSLPLGITELAGPAGVGKTQIALSLCADCVQQQQQEGKIYHQHNKNKAVFIQLGGSSRFLQTASRRLEQMLRSRIIKDDGETETTIHDCMTRVLVHWVCNSEELMELLQTSLPRLLGMHPTISVVVLDGIANLFRLLPEQQQNHRASSNSNPWHDRAVTFFQISNLCKELSSRFEIPFVVLNECTSRIPNAVAQHNQQQKAVLEPALGLAWSQCVNCSFFVRRCESNDRTIDTSSSRKHNCNTGNKQQQQQKSGCSRILQCLKAPHVSSEYSTATFWIDRSGIIPI